MRKSKPRHVAHNRFGVVTYKCHPAIHVGDATRYYIFKVDFFIGPKVEMKLVQFSQKGKPYNQENKKDITINPHEISETFTSVPLNCIRNNKHDIQSQFCVAIVSSFISIFSLVPRTCLVGIV